MSIPVNTIINQEWYQRLVEDCRDIVVERGFAAAYELLLMKVELGRRIAEDEIKLQKHAKGRKIAIRQLADDIKRSISDLYYSQQFFEACKTLSAVPSTAVDGSEQLVNAFLDYHNLGKNARWGMVRALLPEAPEEKVSIPKCPEGKFRTIIIDPPWPYKSDYDKETRRVASRYLTKKMSIEQIASMKLPTDKTCILWLWTTHEFVQNAFEILANWGFEYKALMVWDKEKMGMGHWFRMQCEFCLLGIKGKPKWDCTDVRDIIREPRREHSRKPETFYKMILKNSPEPRFEYFSRQKRKGFISTIETGDEIGKF